MPNQMLSQTGYGKEFAQVQTCQRRGGLFTTSLQRSAPTLLAPLTASKLLICVVMYCELLLLLLLLFHVPSLSCLLSSRPKAA